VFSWRYVLNRWILFARASASSWEVSHLPARPLSAAGQGNIIAMRASSLTGNAKQKIVQASWPVQAEASYDTPRYRSKRDVTRAVCRLRLFNSRANITRRENATSDDVVVDSWPSEQNILTRIFLQNEVCAQFHAAERFFRRWQVAQQIKKPRTFIGSHGALLNPQELAIGPYHEPHETSPPYFFHLQIGVWLIDYGGVRLCLRTAATNGPIVHPPGDMWVWRVHGNDAGWG
jgi:hypothetical protein